jgi:hypothetical protein
MNKRLAIICLLFCLSAASVIAAEEESRFRPGEWDLSPFATYVDKGGNNWGVGASATYFITTHFGIGACTYWTDFGGTFFDNLSAEGYLRLPLFKRLAPYGTASVGFQFDSSEWFETLGAGVDFRAFKKISAFSDVQYRFANETRNGVFIRLGVRFAL